MGGRNVLYANFYGVIDAIRQTIKERFDQEDLKQLINMMKCLTGAANKETVEPVKDRLVCISDLVKEDVLIEELQEFPKSIKINKN